MKYPVSAGRVKILLWFWVFLQIFFSINIIEPVYIFHTMHLSPISALLFWSSIFVPIFLLYAYYQTKKQHSNLFKFCFFLSVAAIIIKIITLAFSFNLLGIIYILVYIDFAMFFKNKTNNV